ncbi:MAG: hypothetical protein K1X79_07585, partial [Oligoflexia bacterium]|nr:hypothetical protein [Oligoflexia bacterium]
LAAFDRGMQQAKSEFLIDRAAHAVQKSLGQSVRSLQAELRGKLESFNATTEGRLLAFLVCEIGALEARAASRGSHPSLSARAESAWASLMSASDRELYAALGRITQANLVSKSFEEQARTILGQRLPQRQAFLTLSVLIGPEEAQNALKTTGPVSPEIVSRRIEALRAASKDLAPALLSQNPHLLTLGEKDFARYAAKLGPVTQAWDAFYVISSNEAFIAANHAEKFSKPTLLDAAEQKVLDAYRLGRSAALGLAKPTREAERIASAAQKIWDQLPAQLDRDLVMEVFVKGLRYQGGTNAKTNPTNLTHFWENLEGRISNFESRKAQVESAVEFLKQQGVIVNEGKRKPIYLNLGKDQPITSLGQAFIDMYKLVGFGPSLIEPKLPKDATELIKALV